MAASLSLVGIARRGCLASFARPQLLSAACIFITPNSLQHVRSPSRDYATSSTVAKSGYGKHWKFEKVVTVGLVGLIPLGLVYPNALVDYGLAVALPLHGHWGFESVIEDYVPSALRKVSHVLLYCVTFGTFVGLMYLNYSDVGICKAVKMVWSM